MFGLGRKFHRGTTVALVDIGSGSVAAGIIDVSSVSGVVLREKRMLVSFEDRTEPAAIAALMNVVEEVTRAVLDEQRRADGRIPSHVYCVVRAPWVSTTTKRAQLDQNDERPVTVAAVRALAQRVLDAQKDLDLKRLFHVGITDVELNGYVVEDPIRRNARTVAVSVVIGTMDIATKRTIQATMRRVFPHQQVRYRTSTEALLATCAVQCDGTHDRLVVDVAAEATTLVSIREGVISSEHVVPEGVHSMLQRIAPSDLPEHTLARLRMRAHGESEVREADEIDQTLSKVEADLVRVFGEAMSTASAMARLPNSLMLVVREEMLPWLSSFFSRIDFGQFTLTTRPFDVHVPQPDILARHIKPAPGASVDVSFLLSAALVNSELSSHAGEWYTLDSMTKEYFDDITPPQTDVGMRRPAPKAAAPVPPPQQTAEEDERRSIPIRNDAPEPRSIRTIAPPRPQRVSRIGAVPDAARAALGGFRRSGERVRTTRWWLWALVGIAVIAVTLFVLVGMRPTTVTVTPRSHLIQLSPATPYVAYPSTSAASGTLTYVTVSTDVDDSVVVPASGSTTTEPAKASGSITVYNAYATSVVNLVKNTRFTTPDGLVFRSPAAVSIPAMKGTTPGSVSVTVVADEAGAKYNIGPVSHLTLPGLTGNPAMYKGVYARSSVAMSGGADASSGPGVDPATMNATVAQLKKSLAQKAIDALKAQAGTDNVILDGLVQITYTDQPTSPEANDQARIKETAHAIAPSFSAIALGQTVGSAVAADADNAPVDLIPGTGFASQYASDVPTLGNDAVQFTLSGQANLIWKVDPLVLASTLAGKNEGAFQTIITGFSGIQEAHAKIEPFWKNTFPAKASDIRVVITDPKADQ